MPIHSDGRNEVDTLYRQCLELISAMEMDAQTKAFFATARLGAESAHEKRDGKYLKSLLKELLWMSQDFPQVTSDLLRAIGVRQTASADIVNKVLERGDIRTKAEYSAVGEFLGELDKEEVDGATREKLELLMANFHRARSRT
jgi:hypothetical protein